MRVAPLAFGPMKIKHLAISSLIILGLSSINLISSPPVKAFTSAAGGFSIWMPGEPTLRKVNHQSVAGTVQENSYTLITDSEKYVSSYTELPGSAFSFLSEDSLFAKAKKGFLKANGATEIGFQKITLAGLEGWELAFQIPGQGESDATEGKARFYLSANRMYVVMITANKDAEGIALTDRYLNSFKVFSVPEKEPPIKSAQRD